MEDTFIPCTTKDYLPTDEQRVASAADAIRINPVNRPRMFGIASISADLGEMAHTVDLSVSRLAFLTTKYFGPQGVRLTVSFMDNAPQDLQRRIVEHMNAWSEFCNVQFMLTSGTGQIRIARNEPSFYSYLGVDNLHIPQSQHTMMLGGFTMQTPESEYRRVVRHETGHAIGCPHEHLRTELVQRLDPTKTIAYFGRTQGWSPNEVRQQVLTPLSESSIRGTPHADEDSIMTYQLSGAITVDGQPIRGGLDIDAIDKQFAATIYPLAVTPPSPPPPPVSPPPPSFKGGFGFLPNFATKRVTIYVPEGYSGTIVKVAATEAATRSKPKRRRKQ